MTDHTSRLTQRVRRLLGTGGLAPESEGSPARSNGHPSSPSDHPTAPGDALRCDTGALFESQISRLSQVLRELHAIDRAREAELRQLREQLAAAEASAYARLSERLAPVIAQLDDLIGDTARLLQPAPPPTATLFERMRARAAATPGQARPEALATWAAALADLRAQLTHLLER